MKKILLPVHTSPETALVVNDYPYGFRLRCKIRYWLEANKNGTRFVSQTTNPKKSAIQDIWNKPKASTYAEFGGVMFLDEKGHVHWDGVSRYADLGEIKAWVEEYRPGLSAEILARLTPLVSEKELYEAEKARGEFDYQGARMVAVLVGRRRKDKTVITLEEAREAVRKHLAPSPAYPAATLPCVPMVAVQPAV